MTNKFKVSLIVYFIALSIFTAYILAFNSNTQDTKEISEIMKQYMDIKELKIETLSAAPESNRVVVTGDKIKIHYVGTLLDGTKFDSSYDRGTPLSITIGVGQVIKGWDNGVIGMKVGEKRKLIIPADQAYGSRAVGNIPANSVLVFELELVEIL